MLSGLWLDRDRLREISSEGRGNWLERSVARTLAVFQLGQSKLKQFLLATVRWSIGRGKIRLAKPWSSLTPPKSLI